VYRIPRPRANQLEPGGRRSRASRHTDPLRQPCYSGSATRWPGSNSWRTGGSRATATWDLPLATARPLPITSREIEIADLVTAGLSNRQIADRLYISVRTTEGHLYRIFAKLGINSRDQLIHLLALNRFGSPDDVRSPDGVRT